MSGKLLALALVLGLTLSAPAARAAEDLPSDQVFTAPQVRADFAALYAGLQQAQYDIYAHIPKAELDAAYTAELAGIDRPMTRFQAAVRFEAFVARIKVAHARLDYVYGAFDRYRVAGGTAFPIQIRVIGQRAYVAENGSGLADIARGDELLAIDGAPTSSWLERASRHLSADTLYLAGSLLELDFPTMLWLELGKVDGFDVRLRKADGRTLDLHVPARTRAEFKTAQAAQQPVFALDADKREARMLADGIAYLRPGPFYNPASGGDMWDPTAFKAFIDTSFQGFIDAKARAVLIDLRENPGGDNSFSDPMVAWFATKPFRFFSHFKVKASPQAIASNQARLDAATGASDSGSRQLAALYAKAKVGGVGDFELPWVQPRAGERFTGKVYLLVDRHSYSNTVNVAALVQDYGFGKVVGEETSDMATTYGAMETFTLPATGLVVGFPKAHIIRVNGDPHSRGVVPDIAIETPIAPGRDDVVLDRAIEAVRKGLR